MLHGLLKHPPASKPWTTVRLLRFSSHKFCTISSFTEKAEPASSAGPLGDGRGLEMRMLGKDYFFGGKGWTEASSVLSTWSPFSRCTSTKA
jgi:hypothetical protein